MIYDMDNYRKKVFQQKTEYEKKRSRVTRRILQTRGEQLIKLLSIFPDVIIFKDGKGKWLEASKAALELFGLTDVDYKGKTDADLAEYSRYPDCLLYCVTTDEEAWLYGKTYRVQEKIVKEDGDVLLYDVLKEPIFTSAGQRKALIVIGRDVTKLLK